MTEQPDNRRLSPDTRGAIIEAARSLVGTPFLHQGRDPKVGLDCQGVLLNVGWQAGYQFTREWPNNHRRHGNDDLLREGLNAEFRPCRQPRHLVTGQGVLDHADPGDVILVELPRRHNLHVGIMVEGEYGTELIHSLAFDGRGHVVADQMRRWVKYVVAAYTWKPDQFQSAM